MDTAKLHVEGMSSGHCEIAAQDEVQRLPGIGKVKASRRKKEATIKYDPSQVTLEEIIDIGYEVRW